MSIDNYKGVIIIEGPGQTFEREIPPNNKKVTIYEANAIAIDNEGETQKVIAGGKGFGLTREEAWNTARDYAKKEIDKIK